jgi:hypothetical protein
MGFLRLISGFLTEKAVVIELNNQNSYNTHICVCNKAIQGAHNYGKRRTSEEDPGRR